MPLHWVTLFELAQAKNARVGDFVEEISIVTRDGKFGASIAGDVMERIGFGSSVWQEIVMGLIQSKVEMNWGSDTRVPNYEKYYLQDVATVDNWTRNWFDKGLRQKYFKPMVKGVALYESGWRPNRWVNTAVLANAIELAKFDINPIVDHFWKTSFQANHSSLTGSSVSSGSSSGEAAPSTDNPQSRGIQAGSSSSASGTGTSTDTTSPGPQGATEQTSTTGVGAPASTKIDQGMQTGPSLASLIEQAIKNSSSELSLMAAKSVPGGLYKLRGGSDRDLASAGSDKEVVEEDRPSQGDAAKDLVQDGMATETESQASEGGNGITNSSATDTRDLSTNDVKTLDLLRSTGLDHIVNAYASFREDNAESAAQLGRLHDVLQLGYYILSKSSTGDNDAQYVVSMLLHHLISQIGNHGYLMLDWETLLRGSKDDHAKLWVESITKRLKDNEKPEVFLGFATRGISYADVTDHIKSLKAVPAPEELLASTSGRFDDAETEVEVTQSKATAELVELRLQVQQLRRQVEQQDSRLAKTTAFARSKIQEYHAMQKELDEIKANTAVNDVIARELQTSLEDAKKTNAALEAALAEQKEQNTLLQRRLETVPVLRDENVAPRRKRKGPRPSTAVITRITSDRQVVEEFRNSNGNLGAENELLRTRSGRVVNRTSTLPQPRAVEVQGIVGADNGPIIGGSGHVGDENRNIDNVLNLPPLATQPTFAAHIDKRFNGDRVVDLRLSATTSGSGPASGYARSEGEEDGAEAQNAGAGMKRKAVGAIESLFKVKKLRGG